MKKNLFLDPVSRNIGYLSLLVFVLSLQVLIILVFVYQFIPMKMAPITAGVPPALLKLFQPNRNHFFYHVFIATAIAGQALVLYICRKRIGLPVLAVEIREFLACEAIWVSWQLFAVFKILQYNNPPWARNLLYAGFAAALLAKIFWPELKRGIKYFQVWLGGETLRVWPTIADGGIILLLLLAIMIPDAEKALVRMAYADNFNHFDQWLMSPLWAYHKGLAPGLQAVNPLNGGALVLVHALVSFIGGVTYGHVVEALCFLAIAYYTAFYFFLRFWLGILPAIFGVLLAVKLQMFHMGINPLIWAYPGQSVLRHTFDVAVFFCLLLFAKGRGEAYLWLAAAFIGVSMAYVFDTGVYMLGALYAYVAVLLLFKDTRRLLCPNQGQWRKILGWAFLPWFSMFIVLVSCFGSGVLHREFWANSFNGIPGWLHGGDSISVLSCLRDRNFFAFFASFVPPVIYMAGAAGTVSMVWRRRWGSEKLLLIPLSIYGLGVYAHFLWHSTINYYYMVPLPLVGCICFWSTRYLNGLNTFRQRAIKFAMVLLVNIGLFTNFLFTYYPNVFNMAGENWEQEKSSYRTYFNFDGDADLVRQWALSGQRVAIISGFSTEILLQADRAPLFYSILTVMNQLGESKPTQVFLDKRILNMTGSPVIDTLMDFLKGHYHYSGQLSNNLILLQRDHE